MGTTHEERARAFITNSDDAWRVRVRLFNAIADADAAADEEEENPPPPFNVIGVSVEGVELVID